MKTNKVVVPFFKTVPIALLMFGTVTVQADVLTVPASAFIPRNNGISYDTNSYQLLTIDAGNKRNEAVYHAPVYLPSGAVVTKMSLLARDNIGGREFGQKVMVNFLRNGPFQSSSLEVMASAETESGKAPGDVEVSDSTINYAAINNAAYGYSLQLYLPRAYGKELDKIMFYAVRITYTP